MATHLFSMLATVDKSSGSYRVGQVAGIIVMAVLVVAVISRVRKRRS
jgi:hypothetical protein